MGRTNWFLAVFCFLLLVGCGPVSVTPPTGDDDDDDNNNVTPPPDTGSFAVSSSNPTIDLNLGEFGIVDITITPIDGYTGTLDLSAKSVAANVDVIFEDAVGTIDQITLDGTNPVTIDARITTTVEVDGNLFVAAPYTGTYTIDFTDTENTDSINVDATISNMFVYQFLPASNAGGGDPFLPHSDGDGDIDMTFYVGTIPVFQATGSVQHEIHTGGFFTHMSGVGGAFLDGAMWSPVMNQLVDLTDPLDVADLEANGVVDSVTAPNFYCHTDGTGAHEGVTRVDVIALP